MKQIGFTLMLFVIALSPLAAACQGLPDNPAPAAGNSGAASQNGGTAPAANPQISDREWLKIQNILHGERITVASTYGPPLQCRFANATDAMLYCDTPGSPDGTGYRFERPTVIYVELDAPAQPVNHHPVWISCIIAGGILTGLAATSNADAGHAAGVGAIGALVTAAIGAPMAMMNEDHGPPQPVIYGERMLVSVPLGGLRPRRWRFLPVQH